jgi:hypothetical protein
MFLTVVRTMMKMEARGERRTARELLTDTRLRDGAEALGLKP